MSLALLPQFDQAGTRRAERAGVEAPRRATLARLSP